MAFEKPAPVAVRSAGVGSGAHARVDDLTRRCRPGVRQRQGGWARGVEAALRTPAQGDPDRVHAGQVADDVAIAVRDADRGGPRLVVSKTAGVRAREEDAAGRPAGLVVLTLVHASLAAVPALTVIGANVALRVPSVTVSVSVSALTSVIPNVALPAAQVGLAGSVGVAALGLSLAPPRSAPRRCRWCRSRRS